MPMTDASRMVCFRAQISQAPSPPWTGSPTWPDRISCHELTARLPERPIGLSRSASSHRDHLLDQKSRHRIRPSVELPDRSDTERWGGTMDVEIQVPATQHPLSDLAFELPMKKCGLKSCLSKLNPVADQCRSIFKRRLLRNGIPSVSEPGAVCKYPGCFCSRRAHLSDVESDLAAQNGRPSCTGAVFSS